MNKYVEISKKFVCTILSNNAEPTTIKYWEAVLEAIKEYDEDIYWACVPQCIRCGACVEPFSNCNFYSNLMKDHTLEEQQNVMKRYDIYNEYREKVKVKRL